MDEEPDTVHFARLIDALDPWLDQVVIIGGWACRLYRLHPGAWKPGYAPLTTLDVDVAVPARLPLKGDDIRVRLLARGFVEDFLGQDYPPVAHYKAGEESSSFYAEFLTPLIGAAQDRKGRPKASAETAGITAQQMRYLDLVLQAPWKVTFTADALTRQVQVANPTGFLAQKILIHGTRMPSDQAKDILYMHDTLDLFGPRLADLHQEWVERVQRQLSARAVNILEQASARLFGDVSDGIRRAARIQEGRMLVPERIAQTCRVGFDEIFK